MHKHKNYRSLKKSLWSWPRLMITSKRRARTKTDRQHCSGEKKKPCYFARQLKRRINCLSLGNPCDRTETVKMIKSRPIHDFHHHHYSENIIRLTFRQSNNSMTPTMNLKLSFTKIQSLGTYLVVLQLSYARKGSYANGIT